MKFFIGDILACPVCKSTNLLIHPIEVVEEETSIDPAKVKCRNYCHYLRKPASQVPLETCRECVKKRIRTGVIVCLDCGRWYPIIDTIAVMLDDEYRDEKIDKKFIKNYYDKIPDQVKQLMKKPKINQVNQ